MDDRSILHRLGRQGRIGTPQLLAEDRYELLGEIDTDDMAVTFKSRDVDLGRDAVMRVLHERHLDDPQVVQRFVDEARLGGQLQHPGIVPVYELGLRENMCPYYTRELVRGATLAAVLATRGGPADDRLRLLGVFERVCQTVAYAHDRGVIHGDLQPADVLIGSHGDVRVLGWGRARVSPGEGPDERGDVFSLGSILCEILTGEPFPEDGQERLEACGADEELVELARWCLRPVPHDRPKNAQEVAAVVAGYLLAVESRTLRSRLRAVEDEARVARARAEVEEALAAAAHQRRARRQIRGLAAALVLVLVLGGGGWLVVERGRQERTRRASLLVEGALQEVALAMGGRDWTAAVAAAEHAHKLSQDPHVGKGLQVQVAAQLADARKAAEDARIAASRVAEDDALVGRLESIRLRQEGAEPATSDAGYLAAYRSIGVDLAEMSGDEAAATLLSRSRPLDLAAGLDAWASLGRTAGGTSGRDWKQLVEIARLVDPDPVRNEIRGTILREDATELIAMAARADTQQLPARTVSLLGMTLVDSGDVEGAAQLLRKAHFRHPADLWLTHELIRSVGQLAGSLSMEAARYVMAAVALRPENAGVWFGVGTAYEQAGEQEAALSAYRKAAGLDPDYADAQRQVGSVLYRLGRYEEAVEMLELADMCAAPFGQPRTWLLLAMAHWSLGEEEAAADWFDECVRWMEDNEPSETTARLFAEADALLDGETR
ncbi:MAG: tetratricopeptide repeat protein [Planctomycetota bacterium]